ncbi:DUF1439 domain-containing protein [Herbaspirillum sp. RTI4]|uniref:DUF1439 domain-containing protein n=1 Tax=Herbaspirillum sp. RTI4 TaxID=3048640 RepID=UPI002AB3879C|nr:DUF1439 domain-containing protein [Herbaspirillum sp. RTI4]MDY7578816.1 DUF1439 domain-containing protein [Herbaspirillum sp. RTI4]MEA9982670.1 DUF1439 domain-containing protein [Herbaspirillum sp. RTI4]
MTFFSTLAIARQLFSSSPLRTGSQRACRTALSALLLSLTLGASNAHADYNLWTGDYTVGRNDLQKAIATRFPRDLTYLGVFKVHLSNPQLSLDEAGNRLVTQVDAHIAAPMLGGPPVDGVLSISSGLKYDAAARAVKLDAPRAEKVDVQGMPAQYASQMNALGNLVADQLLRDYPLYIFTPEQLQFNGKTITPGAITVKKDALSVQIAP